MAKTITITIDTANDAFVDSPTGEIARILTGLAQEVVTYGPLIGHSIRDRNGNFCGRLEVTDDGEG